MKKRAMKKYIPKETNYCHGNGTKKSPYCKWLKYITTIKLHRDTGCEYADTCNEKYWSNSRNSCRNRVYRCEYLNYTDWTEDSLLWDACKECGIHETSKEKYLFEISNGYCKINKTLNKNFHL
jgi:hypothetical protein